METCSLILTSRGLLTLAELAPSTAAPETAIPLEAELHVPTVDGTQQLVSHYYVGGRKPVRTLRTECGYGLTGTFVHPVRVSTDEGVVWRPLSDVRVGDYVAIYVASHPGGSEDHVSRDAAFRLGEQLSHQLVTDGIPSSIRRSTRAVWVAFLLGTYDASGGYRFACERLCRDVQVLFAAAGHLTRREHAPPYWTLHYEDKQDVDGVCWDKVETIEEGEAEVADLSVPNGHSFVANGFQVHNTLIAKTVQAVIAGYDDPFISALGKREEEIEKRITTLLRQQHPVLICDNLTSSVTSESLQQLATSERWQARLLHTNDAPIYPQSATWILTLNAARMNRDIARRSVLIQLDAKVEHAYERSGFRIEDLYTWAKERRANIIRACLVLVRSWIAAGAPRDPEVVRGSFEGWCRVIGGILKHAGFPGLIQALRATSDRDTLAEDHHLFLGLWANEHGFGRPVHAASLGEMACLAGLYSDRLRRGAGHLALGREMAKILRTDLIGRTWGSYRVERESQLWNGYTRYSLHLASASATTPSTPPPTTH